MEERQHHEFHPNSYSGASSSCSVADHRPNFSGDAYPNHQQYYNSNMYPQKQKPQLYNHDRQFNNGTDQFNHSYPQPPHPVNNEHSEPFGGGGFRSNGGGGVVGGFASPQSTPFNGRKRGFHHSGPGAPPDQVDCGHAKLYVVPIPRTATEEDIRPLFEQHGNVIEVVLFKDKRTGQQQGSCFVKYATLDDAERAIKALNKRHTFSGELGPIEIRLAEGKRERFATWRHHQEGGGGGIVDKLYVGNVNRQASNNDIEEIFSQFGFVEEIFIVRDEQRQSRGCAFVKFPRSEMALAAIKALNGTFTMRGCDHPLIVRLAEPKKLRTGEQRGNYPISGPNLGPFSQKPGFRPASSHGVPFGGQILPNAAYPVQQNHTSPNVQAVSQVPIQETTVPVFTQQNPQLYQSPGQMSQMPLHQRQTQDTCPRSSQQTDSETNKQLHMRSSTQTLELRPILQHTKQESPENRNGHHTVASLLPANPQTGTLLECDWSEHTCPDGDKYYYNCVTRQSRWDKPEEFSLFEKQLKNQQRLCNPSQPFQSQQSDLSTQEVVPIPQDLDHVKLQSESSPVIGSICVQ